MRGGKDLGSENQGEKKRRESELRSVQLSPQGPTKVWSPGQGAVGKAPVFKKGGMVRSLFMSVEMGPWRGSGNSDLSLLHLEHETDSLAICSSHNMLLYCRPKGSRVWKPQNWRA